MFKFCCHQANPFSVVDEKCCVIFYTFISSDFDLPTSFLFVSPPQLSFLCAFTEYHIFSNQICIALPKYIYFYILSRNHKYEVCYFFALLRSLYIQVHNSSSSPILAAFNVNFILQTTGKTVLCYVLVQVKHVVNNNYEIIRILKKKWNC